MRNVTLNNDGHPLTHFLISCCLPSLNWVKSSGQGKGTANSLIDWMRSGLAYGRLHGILVLLARAFVEPLAHFSCLCLREFNLRVTIRLRPDCKVLKNICAKPLVRRFAKPDREDSYGSSKKMGEWQVSLWPLLTTFELKFKW